MRVVSINLRNDNPADVGRRWADRRGAVKSVLENLRPDLLGIQEGFEHQVNDLQEWLGDHARLGRGREADLGGEHCDIYFRTDRFTLLEHGDFWLSETPDVPGSKSWQTACPRMATWALLKSNDYGTSQSRSILYLNTHLDHISELARANGSTLILDFVQRFKGADAVVITGDLNSSPRWVVEHFTERGYIDALASIGKSDATWHDFTGQGRARIDYIMVSPCLKVVGGGVLTDQPDGIMPSDHFPVYADLEFTRKSSTRS
jgi:endonuclease/exonuclease/phosphatase family metal-dependent hydrolase